MTKTDAGLSDCFKKHLPIFHWQKIESWSTGQGVPDLNGCGWSDPEDEWGAEFWIECKKATGIKLDHNLSAEQIGWLERRHRAGGRVFIGVRRVRPAGPRVGAALDSLLLYPGEAARAVARDGISAPGALGLWEGGPARWDWPEIARILTGRKKPR